MLNIQVDNGQLQSLDSAKVISVKSGDKIQVSVEPDSNYQVLIADNEADVVLKVTNADGTSFDVVLEGLASLYEAGDVITQLLLDINGEQMVVGNIADLLGALDATAAGGVIGQNRSLAEDNPNIDPNRSAADDSDQLRSDTGAELLGVDGEANERPSVSNVFLVENEILGVEAAGDLNIITGQLTATDPNVADTHTFSIVEGSLSVTDTNGVITLLGDSVTAVVNEDGTYTISGDFNDLSDGEIATVTFDYIATDQGGLSSIPATVSLEITGTNDIPVVEDINLNGELSASWLINASTTPQEIPQGEEDPISLSNEITGTSIENINALFYNGPGSVTLADLPDVNPYDGSAIKYSFNVNAGETITFSWIFNDAERPVEFTEFNDTAFVVIDGQQINVLAAVDDPGFTNSGLFTYTFPDAGTHEITFGVVNDNDDEVDSNLVVTYVTGGELTGTEIAGYVEALGASAVYFETFDTEDVLGVDDTQDEDTNFFTGLLSVADDDVMNEGLHTFHVVQDEENNNIVTVAGTTVVTADDIDVDIIQNEDGTWSYTIDGDFSALAAGETATVSFQYYADDTRGFDGTDGINESSISEPKTITVTITGTNDQPIVENVVRGVDEIIYENSDQDEEDTNQDGILRNDEGDMTVSGQLSASDEDVNDTHTFAQVEESVQSDNQLIDPEDLSVVVNSDGSYSMTGDFTALAAGETATVTFQYTATDSSSGNEENNTSEPKTVSITVTGTNDQPVVEAINANDILASGTETGQEITEEGSITGLWQEGSVHYTYFTVHETTTLSINANSLDFDTYLYLLRNDGDLSVDDFITSDDDGGLELNSYIHITLAPGEYVAAVGDYDLELNEVISGINNENRSGDFTLTFNANHDITTHDTTMNNSVFYETHDATDIPGVDDTQEDVLTSFNSTLATATDDDVNDTHTYHKLGTETIDNELVTDFNVIVNEDGTYSISGNFNPLAAGETATVTFYYYANDGRGFDGTDGINESSISEPKAVTLTITGTNDQPIVQNVVMGVDETIYETHDENPWDNWTHVFPFYNPDMDGGIGLNDEYKNWIQGTLTASDEDVNDTHTFALADMMPVQAPNTQIVHNVNYDTNGVLWGGRGVVDVAFTSSAINANDVSVDAILLSSDNGTDNDTEFYLVGDFDALAAGETATITFKYYATDSSDFQTPGETNTSEYKTVSITVTGTNDQPVVDNVVMGLGDDIIYETHDENPWDDFTQTWPYFNWDDDAFIGLNDEHNNFITGTLSASDEDVNDTHTFALADMTPSLNPNTQIVQNVNYDTNGVFWGGKGTVDVAFTSSAINADDIKIEGIFLASDNGSDNDTNFALIGDFDALAAGETATITFKYYATDSSDFQTPGETNTSEYKTVSITVTGTNDQPVVDNVVMGLGDDIIYETHDENPWDDFTQTWPYFNWDDDAFIGLNDEHNNFITGTLSASDEDVNDTHTFALADMTPSLNPNTQIVQNVNYDTNGVFWGGKGTVDVAFTSSAINADDIKIEGIFLASDNGSDNDTNFALIGDFDALAAGETATITFKYYATDSSDFQTPGETNTSEYKTVSITVTGTNDQPVVDNVVMGLGDDIIYETHDENPWDDFTQTWPYFNWDDDAFIGLNDEHNNFITGTLSASDEDVNDTHTFALADMTPSLNPNTQIVQNVNYDTNGVFWGGKGTVDVAFTSSAINVDDIKIEGIFLASDNGSDNDTNFALIGDFDALAAGETATITFKYYATDSSDFQTPGETNTSEPKFVSITVTGTNDQPVVDNVVMGVDDTIYETRDNRWYDNGVDDTQDDVTTAVFGKLTAMDDDLNDTHVFNVRDYTASDYYGHGNGGPGQHGDQGDIRFDNVEFFQKGPNNPSHNVKMMIDSTDVQVGEIDVTKLVLMNNNAQDSEVDFKLEGNFNALGVGETATVTFEYIANDKTGYGQSGDANNEPSLSEAKLVTITITGTNDQPVVTANKVYTVSEADGDLIPSVEEEETVIREAFEVQDDDVNDTHTFSIESIYNLGEIDMAGGYELFGPVTYIDALGNISAVYVQVKLPAGVDAKDISINSIRVDGGEFEISGSFDALSGEINGNPADVLDIKLKYFAEDQNGLDGTDGINESSRSETHWMNIKVVGTNDVASLGGDNTGNIHEDDTWTIDGQLTITDLDAGEEAYQSVVTYDNVNSTNATALGVLIMDPVSGKWSYFLDHANNGAQIQALGDEQIVEKFIVKSVDGTEQTVTITIQGENDAPLITSVTGDDTVITENQVIDGNVTDATVLADVDASDVDSANLTYTITSGNSEGYFEINSDGEISLTALGENEIAASHVNDRIFDLGVTVSDGTLEDTTTVTITVDDNFVNIPSVDLPASMDSGASNSDNITNVALPTWQLANIAPDALNVIITDENSVIQAQAARSSVDGMWVISNAGAGELSFNGVNWFFTPDNALADGVYGYNAIVVDDAGNEASKAFNITIDTTPPVIDSDDIAADINETLSSINLGEIAANELNGPVTFSVSGAGFSIDQNNNLIFNGELDYENSSSQTATITATDAAGNSISQDVTVEVNNVTGIVSLLAGGVALQTFNCCNDEGWTGHGDADSHPHGVLGWFEDDSDTRSQTFDLDANAGEDVSINFNLSVYGKQQWVSSWGGGYYKGSGWEGDDTFTVTVTDSNGNTITTENYSPDGNVTNMAVSFDITVPDDGEFTVKFQSANTVDSGAQVESWSVDNFEIVGADRQVLTFDDSSEGEIDMAALLDQGNDFEDEGGNSVSTPDSVDDIDLTSGDHILSNLSVEDFIAMTDDDNTLKIKGDSGDEINLDMSQWKVADNDAVDVGNPDAGIDADSDGYVTYTNIDPVGGAAAESLQLLIDENIDVNS